MSLRGLVLALVMIGLIIAVGEMQSWSVALAILNLCLISSVMALGLNIQWGYAGLFNAGVMGFAALGGMAAVLVSVPPVTEAWTAGGLRLAAAVLAILLTVAAVVFLRARMRRSALRAWATALIVVVGYFVYRAAFDPAVEAIEAIDPARTGFLGGMGLPILFSWLVGGLLAAAAAWLIGRIALGLRSDYLAIATLGISEIVIAMLKNEDWLTRGVKNVAGLDRPVPYELDLQASQGFIDLVARLNAAELAGLAPAVHDSRLQSMVIDASSLAVKLCYAGLFALVLIILFVLSQRALSSPWGRMMRAIRDNEAAAAAMGKDVTFRHREVFILGSAVIGIAGAMLVTLDGQFTPGTYNPLRFTFLIWVMVIVGGSGNNVGAVLGGFLVWFLWIEAEPAGLWLMDALTSGLGEDSALRAHLIEAAPHTRLLMMGLLLLLVLRFSPRGLLPEKTRR
ncbi:MAG: branched-chain amino acid ABC transporter permease [Burkholderiaceae bacterium]